MSSLGTICLKDGRYWAAWKPNFAPPIETNNHVNTIAEVIQIQAEELWATI